MTRVLIADDHVLFRRGLKMILEDNDDVIVTGEAGTAKEAVEMGSSGDFDIVLLDITIPDGSGLDALRELHMKRPGLPVIMLTQHPEEQFAVRAMREGASGYVMKIKAPEELMTAMKKVLDGEKYISSSVIESMASDIFGRPGKFPHEKLSRRELQVMLQLASGKTMTEVAMQLNLKLSTINSYRSRIIEKLGLRTTADIIHYAVKNELV